MITSRPNKIAVPRSLSRGCGRTCRAEDTRIESTLRLHPLEMNVPNTAGNPKNKSSKGDWENIISPGQSRCSLADVSARDFFWGNVQENTRGIRDASVRVTYKMMIRIDTGIKICGIDGTETRSVGGMGAVSHQSYLMCPFWSYQNGRRDEREAELIANGWG